MNQENPTKRCKCGLIESAFELAKGMTDTELQAWAQKVSTTIFEQDFCIEDLRAEGELSDRELMQNFIANSHVFGAVPPDSISIPTHIEGMTITTKITFPDVRR